MPVIAFEGPDGVGKTEAASATVQNLGGLAIPQLELSNEWTLGRERVNRGRDVEARFKYFVQLNMIQLVTLRALAVPGQSIILDSSIYRTVATHRVLGSKDATSYTIPKWLTPDIGIFLRLPEANREERLMERDGSIKFSSHWDVALHAHPDDLIQELESFGLQNVSALENPLSIAAQVQQQVAGSSETGIID